ncbi:MAG: hypothetical protein U5R46_02100 [Gammaproteobacteria bacterium]|nr:hypothetical protein [Gammaproteobacteria bacterium]
MSASFDELYRFTVVRKPPADLSKKAVQLPKGSAEVLNVGSDDNAWGFDRAPNQGFLNELIEDHTDRPPAKPEMRDLARRLDAPTDETAWHLLARHLVESEGFRESRAGVAELVRRALANRPDADADLVRLVHVTALLDTLVLLSREEGEDAPSDERWVQLVNRPMLRPDRPHAGQHQAIVHSVEDQELEHIGETVMVIHRMVMEEQPDEAAIDELPLGGAVREHMRNAESPIAGLRHARRRLMARARLLAERRGRVGTVLGDRQFNPTGSHLFSMHQPRRRNGAQWDETVVAALAETTDSSDFREAMLEDGMLAAHLGIFHVPERIPSKIQPMGRQDLLVVRTRQLGYVLADISHIENISAAESKTRVHELEHEDESTFESETVVETSSLSDLTTTTRDEVRKQIQSQQERSINLEGRVRATYRGPVEVEAEASASMSQRRAQSTDVVKNHSVQVVERAVESVRERTMERASRRMRTLVRDTNTHEFSSEEDKALIYQWVKRVDRAAVYNYGERQMYDFIIPKPSHNLRSLSAQAPPEPGVRRQPPEDLFNDLQEAIEEEGLSALDRFLEDGSIAGAFEIGELPPKPEGEWVSVEVSHQTESERSDAASNWHAASQELVVPPGTSGKRLRLGVHTFTEGVAEGVGTYIPRISIIVGKVYLWARIDTLDRDVVKTEPQDQIAQSPQWEVFTGEDESNRVRHQEIITDPDTPGPGALVIDLNADTDQDKLSSFEPGSYKTSTLIDDYNAFASTVSIYCEPTSETVTSWRNGILASIIADYWRQKEVYAQQQVMTQPDADPLEDLSAAQSAELREIEKSEVKFAAIAILRGQDPSGYPVSTNAQWFRNYQDHADEILFVEQAFEWEHLQFTLYPFYWSTAGDRAALMFGLRGGDRQFREFLKAGAARVQIPVRPGFEEDVEAYLNDGVVWSGGERPRIGSPQYVDMVTERMEGLGAPGDETPALGADGNPVWWDYTTPTDLVIMRTWEGDDRNAPFGRYIPPGSIGPEGDPLENWTFGSGAVPDDPSDE